jgi:hypothetical protein
MGREAAAAADRPWLPTAAAAAAQVKRRGRRTLAGTMLGNNFKSIPPALEGWAIQ